MPKESTDKGKSRKKKDTATKSDKSVSTSKPKSIPKPKPQPKVTSNASSKAPPKTTTKVPCTSCKLPKETKPDVKQTNSSKQTSVVPKYIIFGTSLSRAFELFKDTDLVIYIGKSLRTIEKIKDDVITHIRLYCENNVEQTIIMNFGNSDTAFTYFLKNLYAEVSYRDYVKYAAFKYEEFLKEIKEVISRLPCKKNLIILGVLPPIVPDEEMPKMLKTYLRECRFNPPADAVISDYLKKSNTWKIENRFKYNKMVNNMLQSLSSRLAITFVDIYKDTADEKTNRVKSKLIHPFSPEKIHLEWKEYAKVLQTKFPELTFK